MSTQYPASFRFLVSVEEMSDRLLNVQKPIDEYDSSLKAFEEAVSALPLLEPEDSAAAEPQWQTFLTACDRLEALIAASGKVANALRELDRYVEGSEWNAHLQMLLYGLTDETGDDVAAVREKLERALADGGKADWERVWRECIAFFEERKCNAKRINFMIINKLSRALDFVRSYVDGSVTVYAGPDFYNRHTVPPRF